MTHVLQWQILSVHPSICRAKGKCSAWAYKAHQAALISDSSALSWSCKTTNTGPVCLFNSQKQRTARNWAFCAAVPWHGHMNDLHQETELVVYFPTYGSQLSWITLECNNSVNNNNELIMSVIKYMSSSTEVEHLTSCCVLYVQQWTQSSLGRADSTELQ